MRNVNGGDHFARRKAKCDFGKPNTEKPHMIQLELKSFSFRHWALDDFVFLKWPIDISRIPEFV